MRDHTSKYINKFLHLQIALGLQFLKRNVKIPNCRLVIGQKMGAGLILIVYSRATGMHTMKTGIMGAGAM